VWPKSLYEGVYSYWLANGDRGHQLVDGIVRPGAALGDGVVVDGHETLAADFDTLDADGAQHGVAQRQGVETVALDDLRHAAAHLGVQRPLLQQRIAAGALVLGIDDVDHDRMLLAEALQAVERLDEVVELVAVARQRDIDRVVAVILEVRTGAGQDRFGREVPDAAFLEVVQPHLAGIDVHAAAGDRHHARQRRLDRLALGLEVVPDHPVRVRILRDDLQHLGNARRQAVAPRLRRFLQAVGDGAEHDALPVAFRLGLGMVRRHLVPVQLQRRQFVALVAVAEFGGFCRNAAQECTHIQNSSSLCG
jgi:hypothetical protein